MENRIRIWRKKRGYSQAELANRLGMGQPSLQKYESGFHKLTVELMRQLAAELDISPMDLLPVAVAAELKDDVEPAPITSNSQIVAALAHKQLRSYRVLTTVMEASTIEPGHTIITDQSTDAISSVKMGQMVVVAAADRAAPEVRFTLLRLFISRDMLATNRSSRNVVFGLNDDDVIAEIVGVVLPG